MEIMINLNSIAKVKDFVQITQQFACDMTLQSGKHIVDAKSILGIFSLDLSRDLTFTIDGNASLAECEKAMRAISQFEV